MTYIFSIGSFSLYKVLFNHFVICLLWALQDRQLKVKDLVLSTHERAVRNCPWTMGLWKSYLLALERHGTDHQTVSGNNECSMKLCRSLSYCYM